MAEGKCGGGGSDGVGEAGRVVGEATNVPYEFSKLGNVYMISHSWHIKKWHFQFNHSPLMTSLLK